MAIYLKGWVTKCDFNGTTYDSFVEGAHLLIRSNSGRGQVLYVGPDYIEEHDIKVVDYEAAVSMLENNPND